MGGLSFSIGIWWVGELGGNVGVGRYFFPLLSPPLFFVCLEAVCQWETDGLSVRGRGG